jgi:hypothetical protein
MAACAAWGNLLLGMSLNPDCRFLQFFFSQYTSFPMLAVLAESNQKNHMFLASYIEHICDVIYTN